MDPAAKKRKSDENGSADPSPSINLTQEDARKIIESFNQEQLVNIVAEVLCRDTVVLDSVRAIADRDPAQRKLFIRGLGWETNTDKIRSIFSKYGELEEATVIVDRNTGKSKGYGFITFCHIDSALLSMKEPSKKIDGRMTVTQFASSGGTTGPVALATPAADVSQRKIFVGNLPTDILSDRLLTLFSSYGEIEEGPLGFDKQTGKCRGYAMFVYKTVEAAKAALVEPQKSIDGCIMQCKLAIEGKKARLGASVPGVGMQGQLVSGTATDSHSDASGLGSQPLLPGSLSSQFGVPGGGFSTYGGFSGSNVLPGGSQGYGQQHHLNPQMQASIGLGNAGLASVGHASSLGGSGSAGYGGGAMSGGVPYGSSGQYLGPSGYGGLGMGSSLYRSMNTSDQFTGSSGMASTGYPESGPYSSSMYQVQQHQPPRSSPGHKAPPSSGLYQNMPHYF